MRALPVLTLCVALSGCTVALQGGHAGSGGASTLTTSAATHAQANFGSARFGASFGAPSPPGATGGQATFSRGASALLVFGLLVAEVFNHFSGSSSDHPRALNDTRRSIADTCSCYGYNPGADLTPGIAAE